MSARKMTDTKVPEDREQDSGFLSGPIDQDPDCLLSGEISSEIKSDEKKVPSVRVESEYDSGVVVLTEELSNWKLEPQPVATTIPRAAAPAVRTAPSQLPPLSVLFQQDDDGDTQLHIAAIHGCEKAISTLIRVCPNKEWFNVPNDDGQTALHLAAMSGNAVVTRMLVIAGASLAVRDRRGETPLHKATILRNVECIKALLNPVKELPQKKFTSELNQKNYNGQACVHLAASAGHVETLQTLVYYGADINSRENLAGWTALHVAAARGHAGCVQYLRGRGAGADAHARDGAGRTPRRLARRRHPAHPALRHAFADLNCDTDSDSDEDHMYDSDSESLFEKLRDSLNPTLVA